MHATLSAVALKPFIKALVCLSRYGDDLVIHADKDHLSLSATNSSLSAYCRFRYGRRFFSRYRVGHAHHGHDMVRDTAGDEDVKGQLLAKTLLSVMKHRNIEKTVERCELLIVEDTTQAEPDEPDEDKDTLESRLIVRLHCKHGIVKTHRLPLLVPTSLLSPGVPDAANESRLIIGPRAVKDITEHFTSGRGMKNDPQLVWIFGGTDVDVKSLESSIDTKGRAQLATELTISVDEFDVYDVYAPPTTIAFHLREFNATIAFAESMGSTLDLRFTDPAAPLFIDVEGDESDCLFVISTSQIQGAPTNANAQHCSHSNLNASSRRKRSHPDVEEQEAPTGCGPGAGFGSAGCQRSETPHAEKVKKSMKAAQRMDPLDHAVGISGSSSGVGRDAPNPTRSSMRSMPLPSLVRRHMQTQEDTPFGGLPQSEGSHVHWGVENTTEGVLHSMDVADVPARPSYTLPQPHPPLFYPQCSQVFPLVDKHPALQFHKQDKSPLFYPASQLSQAGEYAIEESGLGIEYMNKEELEALLEGDGEEVELESRSKQPETTGEGVGMEYGGTQVARESLELFYDEFGPTQDGNASGRKAFQPLFED
ncbi:Rad9-domain-containing protein [Phlebopus sp. FC_14]|nr:Rad9-domain-containing protein [Phlebopus sp. FC_14]